MKSCGLLAMLGLAPACVGEQWDDPVTEKDVIELLQIRTTIPNAPRLADGQTRLIVDLHTAGVEGRNPSLQATLKTSDGRWVLPDSSSSTVKTVTLKDPQESFDLIAGSTPGPFFVSATVGTFTREEMIELQAPTLADVIESVMVTPPPGGAIADGATTIGVKVCATERQAAISTTQLELRTSDGKWTAVTTGDQKVLMVPLGSRCVDASLIPGVVPQPLAISAAIGRFMRGAAATLDFAPIDRVLCSVSGSIAASTGAGTLTLDARMVTTSSGGKPSIGTQVTYHAVVEPATAAGYFASPTKLLDTGDNVASTFVTYGFPTRITFTAVATAGTHPPVACTPVVLTAPPQPPP